LAAALNCSVQETYEIELSALLHDIGKIGIPDSILGKPSRLETNEFEIMKSHPARSAKILEKITSFKNLIPGIKFHHERYDGLGYPDGLAGENIPLAARIVLIADTYDAMTSTRPYRKGLDHQIAVNEIKKCSGSQFDPYLVEVFLQAFKQQKVKKTHLPKGILKKIA
jgi:HD-GYP domain-containing protein (c-di-GMP phosphodiesterase class II)